jgi:hypothetical protein
MSEVVLATLPGATDHEQVAVVLSIREGVSHISLRHQTYGEGLGWYTQGTVELDPQQVAALRLALGRSGLPLKAPKPAPASGLRLAQIESA